MAIDRTSRLQAQPRGPTHTDDRMSTARALRDQRGFAIRRWEATGASQRIPPQFARIMWEHIALLPGDEAPPWTPHDAARWATALLFSLRHQRITGEDRQMRCPRIVITSACGLASARVLMQGENAGDRPDTAAAVAAIAAARTHALALDDVRRDLPRIDQAAVAIRGFHYDSQDRHSFSQRCSRAFIDDLLYLKACLQMEYIDENRERTRYVATPIVCGRAMDRAIITATRAREGYITRASLTGWGVE